jgi:choline dehydrogenase-like flavoprotein
MSAQEVYDTVIVGTGAGGSMMALELTRKGLKVLSLEYGPAVPSYQLMSFEPFYQAFRRIPYAKLKPFSYDRPEPNWKNGQHFVTKEEVNYTTVGEDWRWRRYRLVGGRTVFWSCVVPRFSPRDFRAASEDGFGEPWPLTYNDIAPYYDRVEEMIGVSGPTVDHPECPKGKYLPASPFRCGEIIADQAVKRLGIPQMLYRQCPIAVITRPYNGRAPCHYCGHCVDGCATASKFDASQVLLPLAARTGNFTLRPNSVVAEVLVDSGTGKARGVRYLDRLSRQSYEAVAKVVILSASTIETAHILLNSKSRQYPNGIGNGSGQVGRNLTDHLVCDGTGFLPQLFNQPTINDDGYGDGAYIPRFNIGYQKSLGYIRGFGIQSASGKGIDGQFPGFGPQLKRAIRARYEAQLGFTCFGERLANADTFVEIDPSGEVDRFGIPIVRIHSRTGDNELKMFRDMQDKLRALLEACKAEDIAITPSHYPPGWSEHEVGTCRMGANPKTSVINSFGQSHEVKNLFLADGSIFAAAPEKNPTLTILALVLRGSEYLADEYKRGNL